MRDGASFLFRALVAIERSTMMAVIASLIGEANTDVSLFFLSSFFFFLFVEPPLAPCAERIN